MTKAPWGYDFEIIYRPSIWLERLRS